MDTISNKFHTIAVILIIIFCFALTPVTLQNDTYYTIKIGEYIMENGITGIDPFSWHDGLSYTFPHWAYDVLMYKIYDIGGFNLIYFSTVFFSCILGVRSNNRLYPSFSLLNLPLTPTFINWGLNLKSASFSSIVSPIVLIKFACSPTSLIGPLLNSALS